MRTPLLALAVASCLLAACQTHYDLRETGISSDQATDIAKSASGFYHEDFEFVGRAEWVPDGQFWAVELTDKSGDHGREYKIGPNGQILATKVIDMDPEDDEYWPINPLPTGRIIITPVSAETGSGSSGSTSARSTNNRRPGAH
jgi:hypothetical protein